MPHSPAKVFKTFYLEMQSWAAHPAVQGGSPGCPWQDGVPLMPGQQCGQSSCSGQRQLPATAADRAGRRIFCSMEAADVRLQLCFWCRQQWECWPYKWSHSAALSKQVPIIRATEKMERFGQTAGVGRMGMLWYAACAARVCCLCASGIVCPASVSNNQLQLPGEGKSRGDRTKVKPHIGLLWVKSHHESSANLCSC